MQSVTNVFSHAHRTLMQVLYVLRTEGWMMVLRHTHTRIKTLYKYTWYTLFVLLICCSSHMAEIMPYDCFSLNLCLYWSAYLLSSFLFVTVVQHHSSYNFSPVKRVRWVNLPWVSKEFEPQCCLVKLYAHLDILEALSFTFKRKLLVKISHGGWRQQ